MLLFVLGQEDQRQFAAMEQSRSKPKKLLSTSLAQ